VSRRPYISRCPNRLNTTTLPAGVYMPDFKTDEGIYYRAPSKIVTGGLGMKLLVRGGIFVPSPAEKDQRLGVWWDQQNQSGGILDKAVSSPTNVHRFDERLVFRSEPPPSAAP
jgi:hypothetical protein